MDHTLATLKIYLCPSPRDGDDDDDDGHRLSRRVPGDWLSPWRPFIPFVSGAVSPLNLAPGRDER